MSLSLSLVQVAEIAPLAAIIAVTVFGIYSKHFQDNLLQRIGMSVLAFGSILRLVADVQHENGQAACSLMIWGTALYCAGCVLSLFLHTRKP